VWHFLVIWLRFTITWCIICQLRHCGLLLLYNNDYFFHSDGWLDLYIAEQTESGKVAVSAGQFKSGPYRSTNSISLSYTNGSSCGSSTYSTTIVFRCRPGMLPGLSAVWSGLRFCGFHICTTQLMFATNRLVIWKWCEVEQFLFLMYSKHIFVKFYDSSRLFFNSRK